MPVDEDEVEELERTVGRDARRANRRRHGTASSDWSSSIRSRSAARRARTWRPTPACSITSASFSPPPRSARARHYDAGRFSFNVAKGRCETCEGEGFVMVELLFLPSVYAPCPTCHGTRYNAKTLEIKYRDKNIAEVLGMTVDAAWEFFADEPHVHRSLTSCAKSASVICVSASPPRNSPAAKPNGSSSRPNCNAPSAASTLYILDEPTTGLHPADVEKLMTQLDGLVDAGNTVIVVEHDMRVVAGSDWVIDMGPGAGEEGGQARRRRHAPRSRPLPRSSRTAPYLQRFLEETSHRPKSDSNRRRTIRSDLH